MAPKLSQNADALIYGSLENTLIVLRSFLINFRFATLCLMVTYNFMKILVVEDDEDVRHGLTQALMDSEFSVEAVDNGAEGLYRARYWDFDAIVLDVMLPEMNGWTVLEAIRREKKTPVLMLTARGEIHDRVRGLQTGADDYMVKPFDARELVARLQALIRRSAGQAANCIEIGRVTINLDAQDVLLDGQTVDLTADQIKIVTHLAIRAGNTVSHGLLSDVLSTRNEEGFSNVLDVQIYRIRKNSASISSATNADKATIFRVLKRVLCPLTYFLWIAIAE
ncbi:response regulator transcription factor [Coraliomargarita algicola]|uniref:Response regulator transcription factor n=1 Tax=Coraliomargarita algicola TaxID=3092156 RepID=A0ABZ0RQI8_9BACT|nr:response regulator transcription factor [Coraliomargarita sp. J2-16]WPJ97509.1 response regulator transcription factor [Coraliomargarita sp. J2-16]